MSALLSSTFSYISIKLDAQYALQTDKPILRIIPNAFFKENKIPNAPTMSIGSRQYPKVLIML